MKRGDALVLVAAAATPGIEGVNPALLKRVQGFGSTFLGGDMASDFRFKEVDRSGVIGDGAELAKSTPQVSEFVVGPTPVTADRQGESRGGCGTEALQDGDTAPAEPGTGTEESTIVAGAST